MVIIALSLYYSSSLYLHTYINNFFNSVLYYINACECAHLPLKGKFIQMQKKNDAFSFYNYIHDFFL